MEMTPVVVAINQIAQLSKVREADIKVIRYPKEHLPFNPSFPGSGYNYFSDPQQVIGKFVTQTVHPGEPLVKQRLRDDLGGGPLAHVLEPGQRAVAIRVNDVTGVGGFLKHGDRVDVLSTRKMANSDIVQTEILLQAIKVLAVDQDPTEDRDKPLVAHTITLEMNPVEAQWVTTAMDMGSLQLTLRNPGDQSRVPVTPPAPRPVKPQPQQKTSGRVAAQPQPVLVTVIKGQEVTQQACSRRRCAESGKALPRTMPPLAPAGNSRVLEQTTQDEPVSQPE